MMQRKPAKSGKKRPNDNHPKDLIFTVSENGFLMDFLIEQLAHKNRNNIKSLLRNKQVWVDEEPVSQFNHPLFPAQKVKITGDRSRMEKRYREFTVVFEDDHFIVIDKAAGLLSMATKNEKRNTAFSMLSDYVKKQDAENRIFIVHRLDRETSGLMVFAKNEKVKHILQENWNEAVLEKTYVAVVEGVVNEKEGTIVSYLFEDKVFRVHSTQNPKKGLKAITHFSLMRSNKNYSLLKVNIETGRKNQIRVHMQELGHTIVGDKKYGATESPIRRLGLHAQKLAFIHPVTGENLVFETKIPSAFLRLF
ncbi:MAG: RNA pseudouridine synthase [Draconibacterium sp.]